MLKPALSLHFPIFIIPLFLSCSNTSVSDQAILTSANIALTNSDLSLKKSSITILMAIRDRATDPVSKESAGTWLPKAEMIAKHSAELISYIETLKNEKQISSMQNGELFEAIIKYKKDMLGADSSIRYEFEESIFLCTNEFDTIENGHTKFYLKFFRAASRTGSSTMLSIIQNSVRTIENKLLGYCYSRITYHALEYVPAPMEGQNSNY